MPRLYSGLISYISATSPTVKLPGSPVAVGLLVGCDGGGALAATFALKVGVLGKEGDLTRCERYFLSLLKPDVDTTRLAIDEGNTTDFAGRWKRWPVGDT